LKNEISRGRCEGIFAIESGFAWITKNKIFSNGDGIILFDSCCSITDNDISENNRAGITITGTSFPKLERNSIYGNMQSGVNIRDSSRVVILYNKIFSNYYQLSAPNYDGKSFNEIFSD